MFSSIVLGFILLTLSCARDPMLPEGHALKTKYVVLVVQDGARLSETFGDPSYARIPSMRALSEKGVLLRNFRNNGITYTNPGHVAMTSGVYQPIDNGGNELPANPTVFQRYLEASRRDSTGAWIVSSKGKISILADCLHPGWQGMYRPSVDCGMDNLVFTSRHDSITFNRAIDAMTRHHPRLIMISFREPDGAAHSGDWNAYLQQVENTDALIGRLWEFIQADPLMKDHTAFLVTNDHGRHLDGVAGGFGGHGDDCSGCRSIFLLCAGPDFREGVVSSQPGELIDVDATIARLLGFTAAHGRGRRLNEIFR